MTNRLLVYGIAAAFLVFLVFTIVRSPSSIDVVLPMSDFSACALEVRESSQAYALQYNALPPSMENRELIAALSGNNPRGITFLHLERRYLNLSGELVDSWGTPVRFEVASKYQVCVISAGPDKVFGIADEIVYP